ncbi:FAST kinase domain-containing protein 5, mitochondrial [Drosophila tropicalis]|uniref:FAST kinase domain-containing protein 5, mitochondrial n=1 Tax=Drosophila tropicalis TaxID=46794 RepID=UPI0035AC0EF9
MWNRTRWLWMGVGQRATSGRLLCRHIRTSVAAPAKMFVDKENQYAHGILEESSKPYQILRSSMVAGGVLSTKVTTTQGWLVGANRQDENPNALYADFLGLVEHCRSTNTQLSEPCFKDFVRNLCDQMHHFTDDQLLGFLHGLSRLPSPESTKSPNYMELWNTLDIECCRRIERWPTNQLLLVSDAWYQLGLARIGEYVWQALRKLGRKVRKLPPEQLVQSMFLCNLLRRPVFEMFDFEMNLARCVNDMTLQELGVMAMGFFKTQTPIRNPELLAQLYTRLEAELDTVEDITLVAMLKVLRYSSKLPQVEALHRLLRSLQSQVERVSLLTCLHMALLGCELQTCNDELIEKILLRFERQLDETRLKDMERICLAMGLFNFTSSSQVEQRLIQRLPQLLRERLDEIVRHPRCFTNCLQFISMRGIHDLELLEVAMEPRFIRHTYPSGLPGRDYFHLDTFAQLLGEKYEGPRLTDKQRQQMGKMYTQYIPANDGRFKLNSTDRILVEIRDTAAPLFRGLSFKHILPNYERCDLVICYDRGQQRSIAIDSTDCPADYSGIVLTREHLLGKETAANANVDTVAIVIAGWNNVIREKNRFTGQFAMKLRQLRQLGHKPVVIYWHEWRSLETTADRQNFLKRRLRQDANI